MALLNKAFDERFAPQVVSRVIRNLSVLVAEVENGALVQLDDPNYPLLIGAVETIASLLDKLLANKFSPDVASSRSLDVMDLAVPGTQDEWGAWDMDWDMDRLQDFDPEFWSSLAEHPFLAS
jgi:hypothetical protein